MQATSSNSYYGLQSSKSNGSYYNTQNHVFCGVNNVKNNVVDLTQVTKEVWKGDDLNELENIIKRLKSASAIITRDGMHMRKTWAQFHSNLAWECQNTIKAQIIYDAFEIAFKDMKEGSGKSSIRAFIEKNHIFIGRKKTKFVFSNSSIAHLADANFHDKFNRFQDLVSQKLSQARLTNYDQVENKTSKIAIAILTCNAGGGHRMVAESMSNIINNDKYEAHIINVDEFEEPLDVVTNGVAKNWHIFWKYRQQENNQRKADLYDELKHAVHQFLPGDGVNLVNHRIQQIDAKLVLNTIHHEPHWLSVLAENELPIAYVNTDYSLPGPLKELIQNVQTNMFRIFTPIEYPQGTSKQKMIGYPVRPGFEMKFDLEEKNAIRLKYHVQEGEDLIVVQMGSLAAGIEQELQKLLKMNLNHKCHLVFLCANNEAAKMAVDKAAKNNSNGNITIHYEGMLSDVEMSKLYQTAGIVMGKPGGCTTAEIEKTGAFLITYHPWEWELPNHEHLCDNDQAVHIKDPCELEELLNSKKLQSRQLSSHDVPDWKKRLLEEIDLLIPNETQGKSEEPIVILKPYANDNNSRKNKLLAKVVIFFKEIIKKLKALFTKLIEINKRLTSKIRYNFKLEIHKLRAHSVKSRA